MGTTSIHIGGVPSIMVGIIIRTVTMILSIMTTIIPIIIIPITVPMVITDIITHTGIVTVITIPTITHTDP